MHDEPPPQGTCAGMLPGVGVSEEERRKRDLSYKPARIDETDGSNGADKNGVGKS